jgi:molybdopterin-containing oxidoreductase family iron-sulfur binding subunit
MDKQYWKGVEELNNTAEFARFRNNEFFEHLPVDEALANKVESTSSTSRRDFLKFLGFSVAAASLAACEAPVKKAIPYVVKPEEVTYGIPNYYASTYFDGNDFSSIIVKTREGRPIKIEGNELSSITRGGTSARIQGSVLSLYDSARLTAPLVSKKKSDWSTADNEIGKKLANVAAAGKKIVIMTSSIPSPSSKAVIADFAAKYPTTSHVVYDAVSYNGIVKGNELSFGKASIPTYRFDKAEVIVGIGADFLANWLSAVEFSRQYAFTRKLRDGKKTMSRHIQIESALSLTGSNADKRIKIKPSHQSSAIATIYNKVASLAGGTSIAASATPSDKELASVAQELWSAKGKSLVVCGSNDANDQVLVNAINSMLSNYGNAISFERSCNLRSSNDASVLEAIASMNRGEVGAIIFWGSNPSYSLPDSAGFNAALNKVSLKVSFADREDETAQLCDYVCPDNHFLESWNDYEAYDGMYSLSQPTIQKLFSTRQAQESLLKWSGNAQADYYAYIQTQWNKVYSSQSSISSFEAFWTQALRDGVYENTTLNSASLPFIGNVTDAASKIGKPATGVEVVLYEKSGIGNGVHANNPWLQELPDPISKVCWDNYFAVLPSYADKMGYKQGNIIEVKVGNVSIKGPVFLQPAMADETIAAAVGYGRTKSGKAGDGVGFNAYPFVSIQNGSMKYFATGVTVNKTVDDDHPLAATQTHHTMMGREIVKETTLASWIKNPASGNEQQLISSPYGDKKPSELNLWADPKDGGFKEFDRTNHSWGLGIDLNSCIGCGACVVACNAENNVAVVGKDEIMRAREMHWIRIDRYYTSDTTKENAKDKNLGKLDMYGEMEKPAADNPEVFFQPVMCQHCNHAPCETVCPVVATTHSSEGINMMAYNRCVGTRYCANNCPYKVRRFNWFKYSDNDQFPYNMNDSLGKMVLNPDVVVRSRGVMEKCSMCVQRIQYGKLEAKKAGRRPGEGEINTACAQSCPTDAIVFGDFNESNSRISVLFKEERSYHLLEEINVLPSVFYQTKVRNKPSGSEA